MNDVRLVPMTRVQRDLFVNPQVSGDREAVMRELISAWDAASENRWAAFSVCGDEAVEAVAIALGVQADWTWERYSEAYRDHWRDRARDALRALGSR